MQIEIYIIFIICMSHLFQNYSEYERTMFMSAYETITNLEAWEFLKHYNPPENNGFKLESTPEITRIIDEIIKAYGNHSGGSMSRTMHMMQQIAKNNLYENPIS